MCECSASEIKNLKTSLAAEEMVSAAYRTAHQRTLDHCYEMFVVIRNTKAELSNVRTDLVDTTKTLDKYRDMHVNMSSANSDLRKSAADLEDTVRTLTEERDLSRELFQGMVSEYADLSDRYEKLRDYYDDLISRYVALLPRNDAEHG